MTGVTLLLSVVLLAVTLTNHRVSTSSSGPILYDEVTLSARNMVQRPNTITGWSYPAGLVRKLSHLLPCCLIFKQKPSCRVGTLRDCTHSCTVVYQTAYCESSIIAFVKEVEWANGSAAVFEVDIDDRDEVINVLQRIHELTIPVILVEKFNNFVPTLSSEVDVRVTINVTGQGQIPDDDQAGNGFASGRSATTFYFVVFAFTILLLLSLTWFVFNYLKRCHHMYTMKRQRASLHISSYIRLSYCKGLALLVHLAYLY